MVELKFTAEKIDGKIIGGVITADDISSGKRKVNLIAAQNNFKITYIEKKNTYIYKAKKGNEKPIYGEQKAFNKNEVVEALALLGYTNINVNRKIFSKQKKPSLGELVNFVKICADMLEEKMTFGEILTFVINDTKNKLLKETLKEISKDLKQGIDSEAAFMKHKNVFGFFTAYMLGLASKSGNMTEIYRATAKFLERRYEFKKSLRSALITPAVTVLLLNAAVVWYVTYIFPETAKLFLKFKIDLPPMTAFTLKMAEFHSIKFFNL